MIEQVLGSRSGLFRTTAEWRPDVKVKNWMQRDVITVEPDTLLTDAVKLMHKHSIRHLPVVQGKEMVGFVTESNLRQYFYHQDKDKLTVSDVMIVNPITVNPNTSIDSAARRIYDYKIGGLPVQEKRELVGIITIADILAAFIEFIGLLKETSRIDIILSDKDGNLDDVLRLIREMGGKIVSVGMEARSYKKKVYYIRLEKTDVYPIAERLEALGHKIVSILE